MNIMLPCNITTTVNSLPAKSADISRAISSNRLKIVVS